MKLNHCVLFCLWQGGHVVLCYLSVCWQLEPCRVVLFVCWQLESCCVVLCCLCVDSLSRVVLSVCWQLESCCVVCLCVDSLSCVVLSVCWPLESCCVVLSVCWQLESCSGYIDVSRVQSVLKTSKVNSFSVLTTSGAHTFVCRPVLCFLLTHYVEYNHLICKSCAHLAADR